MSDPEEAFSRWAEGQTVALERRHLQAQLAQYDRVEILSYLLTLAWVIAMFVAYQLGWINAAVAGVVTLWSFLAGGYVIWQVKARQRAVRARLAHLQGEPPD